MTTEIRPLTENEFGEFTAILTEHKEEPFAPGMVERLRTDLAEGRFRGFLLYVDGNLAGLATVVDSYSVVQARKVLYFGELYIRESFRKRGLGRLLFEYVVEHARSQGYLRLDWRTEKDNTAAQALYAQYETDTDWIVYVMNL